jgi:hypothetical protein
VKQRRGARKFWLTPIEETWIEETWNDGFRSSEIKEIERIIAANIDLLVEAWNGFFATQRRPDLLAGRADTSNGQISLQIRKLAERNPLTLPLANTFSSINRWFSPTLSDVA